MFFPYQEHGDNEPAPPTLEKSETVYRAKIFDVVWNRYGDTFERVFVKHPGAVAVIATTLKNKMVLIRQFRAPAAQWLWEIPAGTLEAGEDPAMCARRELEEETGFASNSWEYLIPVFLAPGYSTEVIHLFRARDARPVAQAREGDEDEVIYFHEITQGTAREMLASGEITDAKTIIAIQYWLGEPVCAS